MTTTRTIITTEEGRIWLWRERLEDHDTHVYFTDPDGVVWIDRPSDLATFEWKGEAYEVIGYSKSRGAWLCGLYTPPVLETMAAGDSSDPRGRRWPLRRS